MFSVRHHHTQNWQIIQYNNIYITNVARLWFCSIFHYIMQLVFPILAIFDRSHKRALYRRHIITPNLIEILRKI